MENRNKKSLSEEQILEKSSGENELQEEIVSEEGLPGKGLPIVDKKLRSRDSFEYYLIKKVGKTIKRYGMIESGDRIIVGVSGGKDSLTLLRILSLRQGFYPNDYELLAVHVASNAGCEGAADRKALEDYFRSEGYSYKIVDYNLWPGKKGINTFWCSWNRRRVLFETANKLGYNKIALAHHRNDIIETLLINVFYHAELSTMQPVQPLFNGRITIIRPLYYIPEADTIAYTKKHGIPTVHCRCPVKGEMTREMFKRLINEVERKNPRAGINALRALENIKLEYLPISTIKENIDV